MKVDLIQEIKKVHNAPKPVTEQDLVMEEYKKIINSADENIKKDLERWGLDKFSQDLLNQIFTIIVSGLFFFSGACLNEKLNAGNPFEY